MNSFLKIIGALFILAILILLLPGVAVRAQQGPPPIPHSLEGRQDCVVCHATGVAGAPKYPADHTGRTSAMCPACHQPAPAKPAATVVPTTAAPTTQPATTIAPTTAAPAPQPAATVAPTTAAPTTQPTARPTTVAPAAQPTTRPSGGIPLIPHPLQNRDNCLACHQTGVGGAPKVPASHAGRTNDMCRGCHQPAAPAAGQLPQILPTPVAHTPPTSLNGNGCVICHNSQAGNLNTPVKEWQLSIHAERNVTCVDCHGGDATQSDKTQAHSVKAGYIGIPKTIDIPALCASCHANVDQMRQYDIPTDQWAKYQESVHGKNLAQGDTKVATCFTCHDGHGTKKTNDPTAQVYSLNVPALCASCHADAVLMKPYNIPTNQSDLYVKSVHGQALLNKQDLRAPNCATCHGTHGAAPPGVNEIANVCGSCHTATQDYYLKSAHASNQAGTPKCVTCHGQHDVATPTGDIFVGAGTRQCGSCHPAASPQAGVVKTLYDSITTSAQAVDNAEAALKRAAGAALIVAPEEVKLSEAHTNLITARAAQHTLDQAVVKGSTDKAEAKAEEVIADADKATSDSIFRRQWMAFGLAVMALAIVSLWIIRRELYKQLPPE